MDLQVICRLASLNQASTELLGIQQLGPNSPKTNEKISVAFNGPKIQFLLVKRKQYVL